MTEASVRLVLATPHPRNDELDQWLRKRADLEVLRVRTREELTVSALDAFRPHWVMFPHWSHRVPAEVHRNYRCVIFHMTDVPYGRGGSPLQNLIALGHTETVMSALVCADEMDAGDVYLKRPLSLLGTAEEIHMRASALVGEMIVGLVEQEPQPEPQDGEPTVFRRRRPEDGDLAAAKSDLYRVFDMIRMLDGDGYPPAFFTVGDLRLEFGRASLRPGAVLADVRITRREAVRE